MSKTIASVHRFGDSVAVHVGDGETTYFTVSSARELASAISQCVGNIQGCKFSNSNFSTATIKRGKEEKRKR